MNWKSIPQLVDELGLDADAADVDTVRRAIRRKMVAEHPDHNNGDFKSKDSEKQFHRLSSALTFVDQSTDDSMSLIPVTQLPAIIEALREVQATPAPTQISQLRTEFRTESHATIKSNYALPKIGSGVFAGVSAFLFAFGTSLKDHPILGQFAQSTTLQLGLLVATLTAAMFFVFAWFRERRDEQNIEWLMSESARRSLFDDLIRRVKYEQRDDAPKPTVTLGALSRIIAENSDDRRYDSPLTRVMDLYARLFFGRNRLSTAMSEKIAKLHLLEWEQRKLISRSTAPSIDVIYAINPKLIGPPADDAV